MQCTINTRASVPLADIKPGETFAVEIQTALGRKASFVGALALDAAGKPSNLADAFEANLAGISIPVALKCRVERIHIKLSQRQLVCIVAVPAQCPLQLRTGMVIEVAKCQRVTPVAPANAVAFAALDGAA